MDRYDRPRQALAISLACLAGFVDAVGYLSADNYFVSFMSGNTTRFAVDLASRPEHALVPGLIIAGFVLGVAGGSIAATLAGKWRKPVVLLLVCALLLIAAVLRALGFVEPALAPMVLAMGALNNTFQRNGEIVFGLTYMTGALVRLGQSIAARLLGGARAGWQPHLLLWAGLFAGALAGAIVFMRIGPLALWLPTAAAALLAMLAFPLAARENA